MNASDVGRLQLEILKFLEEKKVDGTEKVAALKSTAALLENVRSEEMNIQIYQLMIQNVMKPK